MPLNINSFISSSSVNQSQRLIDVYKDNSLVLLNSDEICFIERTLRKTVLYTEHDIYISNKSLNYYEKKLCKNLFFRSHRSCLINLGKIDKCIQQINYSYDVIFKNVSKTAAISREHFKELRALLDI